ncbi:MAG: hypothetical protein Q9168_003541 [Polycauliona sp. 1 TL-2023]
MSYEQTPEEVAVKLQQDYHHHLHCLESLTELQFFYLRRGFNLPNEVPKLIHDEGQKLLELAKDLSGYRVGCSTVQLICLQNLASWLRENQAGGPAVLVEQIKILEELIAIKEAQIKAFKAANPKANHLKCLEGLVMVRVRYSETNVKLPDSILHEFHSECQTLLHLSDDQEITDVEHADEELETLRDLVEVLIEFGFPDSDRPLTEFRGLQELVRKKEILLRAYKEEHGISDP